jgi:hypothetical protein
MGSLNNSKNEEFVACYTLFGELRDDANKFFFLNYFRMSYIFWRDASTFEGESSAAEQ